MSSSHNSNTFRNVLSFIAPIFLTAATASAVAYSQFSSSSVPSSSTKIVSRSNTKKEKETTIEPKDIYPASKLAYTLLNERGVICLLHQEFLPCLQILASLSKFKSTELALERTYMDPTLIPSFSPTLVSAFTSLTGKVETLCNILRYSNCILKKAYERSIFVLWNQHLTELIQLCQNFYQEWWKLQKDQMTLQTKLVLEEKKEHNRNTEKQFKQFLPGFQTQDTSNNDSAPSPSHTFEEKLRDVMRETKQDLKHEELHYRMQVSLSKKRQSEYGSACHHHLLQEQDGGDPFFLYFEQYAPFILQDLRGQESTLFHLPCVPEHTTSLIDRASTLDVFYRSLLGADLVYFHLCVLLRVLHSLESRCLPLMGLYRTCQQDPLLFLEAEHTHKNSTTPNA